MAGFVEDSMLIVVDTVRAAPYRTMSLTFQLRCHLIPSAPLENLFQVARLLLLLPPPATNYHSSDSCRVVLNLDGVAGCSRKSGGAWGTYGLACLASQKLSELTPRLCSS